MELIPDLSICVTASRGWSCLRSVLNAFYAHRGHVSLEFFVVEGKSVRGLDEKLGKHFPEVHIFERQEGVSEQTALNTAIRLAGGRYVALWDDDLICRPGCLPALIDFMDDTPDTGAVGPKLFGFEGNSQPSCFRFPSVWNMISGSLSGRDWREISDVYVNTAQEVDWLSGAALIFRREALEEVGLLDEGYSECFVDLDWCRRAGKAGWHINYYPSAAAERVDCSEEKENQATASQPDQGGQMRDLIRFFRKNWLGR